MTGRIALKWGVILGIAVCVWTLILHALGWYTVDLGKGQIADQVVTILPIAALFMAIRERARRHLQRAPSVGEALSTGLATGAVSLPITAGFLWVYHRVINPRWLDLLVEYDRERLTRSGASSEEIAERINGLIASGTDSAQAIAAVVGTLILSALISILVWGFLRLTTKPTSTVTLKK
jgi:hypothetical protein